jgi:hypothetical protein
VQGDIAAHLDREFPAAAEVGKGHEPHSGRLPCQHCGLSWAALWQFIVLSDGDSEFQTLAAQFGAKEISRVLPFL